MTTDQSTPVKYNQWVGGMLCLFFFFSIIPFLYGIGELFLIPAIALLKLLRLFGLFQGDLTLLVFSGEGLSSHVTSLGVWMSAISYFIIWFILVLVRDFEIRRLNRKN